MLLALFIGVMAVGALVLFRDGYILKAAVTAQKQQNVVTFVSEESSALNRSTYALEVMGLATKLTTILPKGRYIINAPSGYSVVGSNLIELSSETNSMITMVNADGKHLFTSVRAAE